MNLVVRPMGANLTRDTEVFGRMVRLFLSRIHIVLSVAEDKDR